MVKLNTLKKGIQILSLFTEDQPILDVNTISSSLDIPSSTVYRYLSTFKSECLIEDASKKGYYKLGLGLLKLAKIARYKMGLVELSLPVMESLSIDTKETIVLTRIRGHQAVCIERIEGLKSLRVSYEIGSTQYLHAGASAKAIMAFLDRKSRKEVIDNIGLPRLTENTITNEDDLYRELELIRENGYDVSEGEVDPGVRAIASPIFDEKGRVIASISAGGPSQRLKGNEENKLVQIIKNAGEEITNRLKEYGI